METSGVLENLQAESADPTAEGSAGRDVAALYDDCAASLYRYLLTLLGHVGDAEDAVQEAFLGLMRRGGLRGIRDPRAYLFQAARRQALQVLRRRRRRDKESAAAEVTWIDTDAGLSGSHELALDIDRAMRQLSLEQREMIALKLSEGLSFREIAEVMGIPLNTAASRYRRALARLRELLEEGDGR